MAEEYKEMIQNWNTESKEGVDILADKYGNPDEITNSQVIWYNNGPWAKTVVYEARDDHHFPMKHTDFVEQSIFYYVTPDKFTELAEFDGSVTCKRTAGMISAKCHDEEANFLALNLAHDINTNKKTVEEARNYYVQAMKDYRAKKDVPYMQSLQFEPLKKQESQYLDQELVKKEELDEIEESNK